jgi:hypothetical protein
LLNGPKDLSVENRIRAVLGCLSGIKEFGLEYGQAGRNFGLGFRLKPKRRIWAARRCVKSPAPKSSSPKLVAEDHLGAAEAVPPVLTQSVGRSSSPVSSSALPLVALSPEDGVRTGSSSEVRQNPPVCLSEEVAHSQAEEPAPQARLVEPEPSDAGLPVPVHQIEMPWLGLIRGRFRRLSWFAIPLQDLGQQTLLNCWCRRLFRSRLFAHPRRRRA